MARGSKDKDEKGSDSDRAEGIANPPGKPNRAKIIPASKTRATDDADTDGGANGGSQKSGKTNEAKNIFCSVERLGAVGELIDEVSASESLKRVAYGDTGGDDDGGVDVID